MLPFSGTTMPINSSRAWPVAAVKRRSPVLGSTSRIDAASEPVISSAVYDVVEQRLQPRGGVHDAANLKQATENVEFALEATVSFWGSGVWWGKSANPHFTWTCSA